MSSDPEEKVSRARSVPVMEMEDPLNEFVPGSYNVGNSSTKLILLNTSCAKSKSHMRGFTTLPNISERHPDPDRHSKSGETAEHRARHSQCKESSSTPYVPPFVLDWSNYSNRHTFSNGKFVNDTRHVDCHLSNNNDFAVDPTMRPSPEAPRLAQRDRLPPSYSAEEPLPQYLTHPELRPGDKRYMYTKAGVYSMADLKALKQEQYEMLLNHEAMKAKKYGFCTQDEVEQYWKYLRGPRKRQFSATPTVSTLRPSKSSTITATSTKSYPDGILEQVLCEDEQEDAPNQQPTAQNVPMVNLHSAMKFRDIPSPRRLIPSPRRIGGKDVTPRSTAAAKVNSTSQLADEKSTDVHEKKELHVEDTTKTSDEDEPEKPASSQSNSRTTSVKSFPSGSSRRSFRIAGKPSIKSSSKSEEIKQPASDSDNEVWKKPSDSEDAGADSSGRESSRSHQRPRRDSLDSLASSQMSSRKPRSTREKSAASIRSNASKHSQVLYRFRELDSQSPGRTGGRFVERDGKILQDIVDTLSIGPSPGEDQRYQRSSSRASSRASSRTGSIVSLTDKQRWEQSRQTGVLQSGSHSGSVSSLVYKRPGSAASNASAKAKTSHSMQGTHKTSSPSPAKHALPLPTIPPISSTTRSEEKSQGTVSPPAQSVISPEALKGDVVKTKPPLPRSYSYKKPVMSAKQAAQRIEAAYMAYSTRKIMLAEKNYNIQPTDDLTFVASGVTVNAVSNVSSRESLRSATAPSLPDLKDCRRSSMSSASSTSTKLSGNISERHDVHSIANKSQESLKPLSESCDNQREPSQRSHSAASHVVPITKPGNNEASFHSIDNDFGNGRLSSSSFDKEKVHSESKMSGTSSNENGLVVVKTSVVTTGAEGDLGRSHTSLNAAENSANPRPSLTSPADHDENISVDSGDIRNITRISDKLESTALVVPASTCDAPNNQDSPRSPSHLNEKPPASSSSLKETNSSTEDHSGTGARMVSAAVIDGENTSAYKESNNQSRSSLKSVQSRSSATEPVVADEALTSGSKVLSEQETINLSTANENSVGRATPTPSIRSTEVKEISGDRVVATSIVAATAVEQTLSSSLEKSVESIETDQHKSSVESGKVGVPATHTKSNAAGEEPYDNSIEQTRMTANENNASIRKNSASSLKSLDSSNNTKGGVQEENSGSSKPKLETADNVAGLAVTTAASQQLSVKDPSENYEHINSDQNNSTAKEFENDNNNAYTEASSHPRDIPLEPSKDRVNSSLSNHSDDSNKSINKHSEVDERTEWETEYDTEGDAQIKAGLDTLRIVNSPSSSSRSISVISNEPIVYNEERRVATPVGSRPVYTERHSKAVSTISKHYRGYKVRKSMKNVDENGKIVYKRRDDFTAKQALLDVED